MKSISLLSIILLWGVILINAQDIPQAPKGWFDLQIAQSFGLNDWHRVKFASDRLPGSSSSTDLRVTANLYIIRRTVGIFSDMGISIMPAPRNGFSDPAAQATFTTGIPHYTKEVTVENGYQTATGHFKMTFGVFGRILVGEKFSVLPGFGGGFMTISAPTCEAILKEHDTNMQYIAFYQWFGQDEYGANTTSLGYLTFRLRFAHHMSSKHNLFFGIEYTLYPEHVDFSETYTNYFNHNIVKIIHHKGNRLNMLGLSFGVSF